MNSCRPHPGSDSARYRLLTRNCIALVLHKIKGQEDEGAAVFSDFLRQNSMCFWNPCLVRSVSGLEYRGWLVSPGSGVTLLVSGTHFALEVVRSAWARRVLRPPRGYAIGKLGDVGAVDMLPVAQTQFAPLSEALCKVVADLNGDRCPATADSVRSRLEDSFPEMQVPFEDILHRTLGGLIRERKLYHNGNGYFIVSSDTYHQRAPSPLCERQMLMTNEEAIARLHHGCSDIGQKKRREECSQVDEMDIAAASFKWRAKTHTSSQVASPPERSRILRIKGRHPMNPGEEKTADGGKEPRKILQFSSDLEGDINGIHKSEKQSVLAKILRRMQLLTDKSARQHVVFSAQFPPLEWLEGQGIRCHSVATQTQLLMQKVGANPVIKRLESMGPRIPWEGDNLDRRAHPHYGSPDMSYKKLHSESDGSSPRKNLSLPTRQSHHSRYSPSHRYSHHGSLTNYVKRRHRHRRSSSDSPKAHKTLLNCYQSQSTSSKSNADNRSSSSGSILTAPADKESKMGTDKTNSKELKWVGEDNISRHDVQTPSNSLDREVLKDAKNISPSHTGLQALKIGNIPPPPPSDTSEMHGTDQNASPKSHLVDGKDPFMTTDDQSRLNDSSYNEKSCNAPGMETIVRPLVLKSLVDIPTPKSTKKSPPKEIIVDNSVSVELALDKSPSPKSKANNVSTTIVTEETTVTKANGNSKVVTVTSITTSLSRGGLKDDLMDKRNSSPPLPADQVFLESSDASSDKEKSSVNDLNIETGKNARIIDCTSSCNIVTEVK